MPVSPEYRDYVIEQLERVHPVRARSMFGGVGLYHADLFFALLDDDNLYFKVDDSNRGDFETLGMGPFRPFGNDAHVMQYYEVPADVLENADTLRIWMDKAIAVAAAARPQKTPRSRSPRETRASHARNTHR